MRPLLFVFFANFFLFFIAEKRHRGYTCFSLPLNTILEVRTVCPFYA